MTPRSPTLSSRARGASAARRGTTAARGGASGRGSRAARHDDDRVWRALADGTRRQLLDLLAEGPATTGELVLAFDDLCRTAVMKHLDVLEEAELLIVRREGRRRWNHLNPVPIQRLHERWVAQHVRGSAAALDRLKEHVETPTRRSRR